MGGRGAGIKIKTHEDTDILEWYVWKRRWNVGKQPAKRFEQ